MIIEGEVVESTRLPDVLPPSQDEKLAAMSRWTPEQQVEHVTLMLVQANTGLLLSIAAQDLPGIVTAKAKAATIEKIVAQLRLGKDMRRNAAEFCRRAERGLGVAIREGQERGEIETWKEARVRAGRARHSANESDQVAEKPRPTDFAEGHEFSGVRGQGGIYAMTDGVSDEQFEEAIAEAKSEGNLSRANVARKCKAKSKPAIEADDPLIDADVDPASEPGPPQPKKRLTKHDSTEMLANINGMLNGIVETIPFINPAEVDAKANKAVIDNIGYSMGRVRKLLREIENG